MSLYDRDRGDQIRANADAAMAPILALARLLQRAVFQERPEQSAHRAVVDSPATFEPAPLYREQARVLNMSPSLRQELVESLQMMQRRHGS